MARSKGAEKPWNATGSTMMAPGKGTMMSQVRWFRTRMFLRKYRNAIFFAVMMLVTVTIVAFLLHGAHLL